LTGHINERARAGGLITTNRPISQKFVLNVIVTDLSIDPDIERMDPKLVAALKSKAPNRIVTSFPFERIEQDAVHLPFFVETPHGPVSNIYLIHAIDCCTGMPVGWHMKIGQPSESDGLRCVESILFPKQEKFKSLGLEYDFDIYGTPHKLIFDNGPETKGERMRKLTKLGIDVMHCKARHAQGKPFIERLNRSLKEGLQTLRGCTRFNGKDGMRDPIELGDKLMTFQEIEIEIVRWYYETWGTTVLKRHLRTEFPGL
jgi:putative transposase